MDNFYNKLSLKNQDFKKNKKNQEEFKMYIYDRSDVRFAYELYFKKFKDEQSAINIVGHSETSQAYANVDIFEFENSYLVEI